MSQGYNAILISTIVDKSSCLCSPIGGYNAILISTIVDLLERVHVKYGYNAILISTIVDYAPEFDNPVRL